MSSKVTVNESIHSHWYLNDPKSASGVIPVFEDDYVVAIFKIAKKRGIRITDKMILEEVNGKQDDMVVVKRKRGNTKLCS